MSILNHLPSFDFPSIGRFIGTAISFFTLGIGSSRWFRVKRKNRRFKIRTLTLEKLRLFLEYHTEDPEPLQIELVQAEVFGEHWYHITIPSLELGKPASTWSFYTRSNIPTGFYKFSCRPDSLLFSLLGDDKKTLTNFCAALLTRNA